METQQLVVLFVALALVAAAVYFTLSSVPPVPEVNESGDTQLKAVENLLFKGLEFGKGEDEYVYSFTETSDGYQVSYKLSKKGNISLIEVENPLSTKEAYFLENDTILCVNYTTYVCSSVGSIPEVENYLDSLEVKFFDDARIDKDMASMRMLLDKNYVTLSPEISAGPECSTLNYRLDFSRLTLSEAALFGIGSDSPKTFDFELCVDNRTGYLHTKRFNYSWQGTPHDSEVKMVSFQPFSGEIEVPEEVAPGAVAELRKEREQAVKLARCFTDSQGEDREKCISLLALQLKDSGLCSYSGTRMDRCLVSLVPLLKDESICTQVTDGGFKDDCYIELAGAYKDSSYCGKVLNASKSEACQDAAAPPPPKNESGGFEMDVESFLDYVENYDDNQTNQSMGNASNGSG